MSAFKRHQSKVFWSQMESQDTGGAFQVPASPSPRARPRPRPFPASRESEEAFSLSNDENLDAPDSDTTDPENTTVIHIDMCDLPARRLEQGAAAAPAVARALAENVLEERSFSPASRGQRSQDSGFSDSDRSDNSSDPESPRRRRRRRGSSRRQRVRMPDAADRPAHTSTPKREPGAQPDRPPRGPELPRRLDYSINESSEPEDERAGPIETLGDFLYSSEPPEEEHPSLGSSSTAATYRPEEANRRLRIDARAPVKSWLRELCSDVEEECMATLQSKSLPRRRLRDEEPESRDLRLLTASATTAAKKVIDTAGRIDERYQRVLDALNDSQSAALHRDLLSSLVAEATEILAKLGSSLPRRAVRPDGSRSVAEQLTRLKYSLDRALDSRLDFYIEKVVRGLEEAPRESGSTARGALAALTALGLAGPRAGASVARCSGIRALLTSLVSSARLSSELRSASLRALASVCCCLEAVDQFVAEGGPEILADVLGAEGTPEPERAEAAALLVQVTAPWMDRVGLPYVEPYGRLFVAALTDLAEKTSCRQTLLLAAAGINHLARSRSCIGPILGCDSIKKLLRCIKKSKEGNVWLMEQVASLVGQVARVPQARAHLVESRASVALVCFLRMQPPGLEDEYRRLAATTSEALTRLCVDPQIAKQVVAVGGSDCLPSPDCAGPVRPKRDKDEAARLHSTKSLRLARRIAAEQIGIARIHDRSPR